MGEEDRRELEEALGKSIEGNIGKKKLQKLQDKAEKKKQREAEQQEREENSKKREALDEKERLEREKEKEEERLQEEEEKRKREEEENMLLNFINYIKETKVVKLEDHAAHFKLKTQEAIDRVTTLLADGMITGVIDDRGKFIYISREELEAVAKYIKQQGRVSITDLAASSNKLIKL